jgi:GNAT superfamily N-acetyltransferase
VVNETLPLKILFVETAEEVENARTLFVEYAKSLNFSLCFQGFDEELANLPGEYRPPLGRLLLAYCEGKLAGCGALRKFDGAVCEMKRLFVRPEFRGKGIGRILAEKIISEARAAHYELMRLDTVTTMKEAIALYNSLGFTSTVPYRFNPMPETLYMELQLQPSAREKTS